jgi:hypothetical protein
VGGPDRSRARELLDVSATTSQSLHTTLHKLLFTDPATRPTVPDAGLRACCWLAGAVLAGVSLWRTGRYCSPGAARVLEMGSLTLVMLLLSPISHRHYFCLAVPLVMGLLAAAWEARPAPALGTGLGLVLLLFLGVNAASNLPAGEGLRENGAVMYAALLLWLAAVLRLGRRGGLRSWADRWPARARPRPGRIPRVVVSELPSLAAATTGQG